ncbi:hypothetical protein HID58_090690 [Brassica napus]|uniref:Uncharacterized protein n=1 Tax=Brassica napus TaxID=3708 RepID=A0ABQ7XB54_BRANA|nr:hypothetical protein HID58_090690 [Brassica napus]
MNSFEYTSADSSGILNTARAYSY